MNHHKRSSVPSAAAPSWKIKLIGMMTNPIAPAGAGFLIWRWTEWVHGGSRIVGVNKDNPRAEITITEVAS